MNKIVILAGGWSESFASHKSCKAVSGILKKFHQDIELINLDPKNGLNKLKQDIISIKPQLIINLVHGYWGEDGLAQKFLDQFKIPYTGPKEYDALISMNKHLMHEICRELDVPIAKGDLYSEEDYINQINFYPHILKPIYGGSSYGIKFIKNKEEQVHYKMENQYMICEEFISGPELCIAIHNNEYIGSLIIEHDTEIYTVEAKKTDEGVRFFHSKKFHDQKLVNNAIDYALELYKKLNGHGIARIDFKLSNKPYFIDYNSIPGFVLIPRIFNMFGYSESELINKLTDGLL